MSGYDDLVRRLRRREASLLDEAADAIEALAAERDAAVKRAEQAEARLHAEQAQNAILAEANHTQALCINFAAGALGPDYSATIEGLPKACASMRQRAEKAEAERNDFRHRLHAMHRRAQRAEAVKGKALAKALAEVRAVALREALASPRLPKLTEKLIEAALVGHYGKRAFKGGIHGVDLTSNDTNYTFAQGFRRMWRGIGAALAATTPTPTPVDDIAAGETDINGERE